MNPAIAQMLAQQFQSVPNPAAVQQDDPALVAPVPPGVAQAPAGPVAVPQVAVPPPDQGQPLLPFDPQHMTPQERQLADNQREEALESQLRSQQQREGSGDYGVTMPSGPLVDTHGDPTLIDDPAALQKNAQMQRDAQEKETTALGARQKQLLRQQAITDAKLARDDTETNRGLATQMHLAEQEMQGVRDEVAARQNQVMLHYQQTQKQMGELAAAEPKDLYGQAGVNGIMGRIAVFLGGAGVNGMHENRNLQYIQTLANNNISQEKRKFEYLSRIGQGDQSMYGMLMNRLQNEAAVHNTMHTMALEAYKAQLLANSGKYADPSIKNKAEQEALKIDEAVSKLNQASEQSYASTSQHTLDQATVLRQGEIKQAEHLIKAGQAHENQRLEGFWGYVPKTEHAKLSKLVGGSRILVDGAKGITQIIQSGGGMAALREYFVKHAIMFSGARDFLETGTRIEAGEQAIIDQLASDKAEGTIATMSDSDLLNMAQKMEAVASQVTRATFMKVKAAAPDTVAFDSADPVWGEYNPRYYQPHLSAATTNLPMTSAGQQMLKQAPLAEEPAF